MSTTSRIAPIAIAGVVGIVVGWMLGPDIGAMRDDFAARFNEQTPIIQQLQASVADIQGRIGNLPDAETLNARLQEQLTAAQDSISGQVESLTSGLQEQAAQAPEALSSGMDEIRARLDELSGEVASVREEIAAGIAPQGSETGEDEAGRLAEEIGAEGAVLLAGQAALFGGSQVRLVSLDTDAGTAVMNAGSAEETVEEGGSLEVSDQCSVTIVGIASNAAYLSSDGCADPAAAPAAEGAPAGGEAAQGASQPAPAAQPPSGAAAPAQPGGQSPQGAEAPQENQPPAGAAPANQQERGSQTPAEGAQAVPEQQPGQTQENAPNATSQERPQPAQ